MRQYNVKLNGKSCIVKAESWFMAFRLAMVGHSAMPHSLVIKPIKRRKVTAFEQALPSLLKFQAH